MKRVALAGLAGWFTLIAVGFFWHSYVAEGLRGTMVNKAVGTILAMHAVRAVAIALLDLHVHRGNGLLVGALLGVVAASPTCIVLAGTGQPLAVIVTETIFQVVQGAAAGAVIARVMRKPATPSVDQVRMMLPLA